MLLDGITQNCVNSALGILFDRVMITSIMGPETP